MDLPLLEFLTEAPNPLLIETSPPVVYPLAITRPMVKRRIPATRRIEDQRRAASAAEVVEHLERDGTELVGVTRGQWSLCDLITAVVDKTGPAALSISTWTAAGTSVQAMLALLQSGQLSRARWLVDATFVRRVPALVAEIRRQFGADAIRVTRTHAKFATIVNDEWQIALRSSMDLNANPRMESYEIGHDPQLCDWLVGLMDDIWAKQPRRMAEASHAEQSQWFQAHG